MLATCSGIGPETGDHVQGVRQQLPKRVVRSPGLTRIVGYLTRGEARRPPRQQHVDGHERAAKIRKRAADLRPDGAEAADLPRRRRAQDTLQRQLGDLRRQVPPQTMTFFDRRPVDNVVAIRQFRQQRRDHLGTMLEIVVHGDRELAARITQAAQGRVVLPEITHQTMDPKPRVGGRERYQARPRIIRAAVVDANHFKTALHRHEHRF